MIKWITNWQGNLKTLANFVSTNTVRDLASCNFKLLHATSSSENQILVLVSAKQVDSSKKTPNF